MQIRPHFALVRTRIRHTILLNLLKVYYWGQRWSAREAAQLKRVAASLLDAEIRLCHEEVLQIGEDDNVDAIVEYVARQLTKRPLLPELDAALQTHSELAIALLECAKKSDDVQLCIASYFLADAFFAYLLKDDERKEAALADARSAISTSAPFDVATLVSRLKQLKQRLRTVRAKLAERSAIKVNIGISDVSASLAVVTAVFVTSGFLYTRYYFGAFGVDVSLFFSVSDYLAASIEQIRYATFSALVGSIGFLFGLRHASMRSRLEIRRNASIRQRQEMMVILFTVVVFAYSAWTIYAGEPDYKSMRVAGTVAALWGGAWIAEAFFKRPLFITAIATALITFTSHVGIAAFERATEMRTGRNAGEVNVNVQLKNELFANQEKARLLGSNSSYVFLLTADGKAVKAVPRDKVEVITVEPRK